MFSCLLLLLPVATLLVSPCDGAALRGRVDRVLDGDTLILRGYKIRLSGIDAPELKQPYGITAKDLLTNLTSSGPVEAEYTKLDLYGRIVGQVWLYTPKRGRYLLVNGEMVGAGLAWAYMCPKSSPLRTLENVARKERRALWQSPNPIPPWTWRKEHR